MDKKYISLIEKMGYEVDLEESQVKILCNGKELNHKNYKVEDNNSFIKVTRFYGNSKQRISLYDNGILEARIRPGLNIIMKISDEKDIIKIKLDLRNNKEYDEDEKTLGIIIGRDRKPGYICVTSENLLNNRRNSNVLGTVILNPTGDYSIDGAIAGLFSGISETDNFVDIILKFLSKDRTFYMNDKMREGIDLIFPPLYLSVDSLITHWMEHLDEYLESAKQDKNVLLEERERIERKLAKCNIDIEKLEMLKRKKDDYTEYSETHDINKIHLI